MTDWKFQVRADSNDWATELYSSSGKISDAVAATPITVASDTVGKYPIDVWFVAPKGKEFVNKENNSTDFVQIPYATKNNVQTKLYADGRHLSYSTEDSYAALSWDAEKYGGSYHLQITEKGVNDNLYFNRQDDGSMVAICYPYLHMQESSTPTPKEYDVVYNLSNCTVSPQPERMIDGTTYNLTFNLASGYKYDVGPKAVWQDGYAISHEGTLSGNVLTLTPADVVGSIKITATAIMDTPTTEYGTARVYRVNDSNMDSISEWAANQAETFDISKYIYTLRKFFFDVSAETDATIRFGRYDTKVAAKLVENDEFDIDCGTVSIEGIYKNAIDYDSDIEFYLPFVGPISISTNRVMDSTVSLVYHVNVLNGDCVASIYVNDIEVGRASGNISYEVPYTNSESYSKNIGTVQPQYLANLTPSVTISTPIAETTGVIGQRSIVTIGSLKGFAKFDNVQSLVIDGTKGEIDMIKSLLESGVYIA